MNTYLTRLKQENMILKRMNILLTLLLMSNHLKMMKLNNQCL
jgi:hypothetical protein